MGAKELKAFTATIALILKDTQKLLDETTTSWAVMEEIKGLVAVWQALPKNQQELEEVTTSMKDMPLIQRMLKMGENKRLHTDL